MESCDNGSRAVLKTVVPAMVLGVRISRSPNFKKKMTNITLTTNIECLGPMCSGCRFKSYNSSKFDMKQIEEYKSYGFCLIFKEKIYFTKMEDDCHYLTRLNKCLESSK